MTMSVKKDWNWVHDVSQSLPISHECGKASTYGNGEAPTHGTFQKEESVVNPVGHHDTE
jgi:hypothetical protein